VGMQKEKCRGARRNCQTENLKRKWAENKQAQTEKHKQK